MTEDAKIIAQKSHYDFDDLLLVMRLLRSPDGCPWDREQTHKSIRGDLIEETYEVVEAIDNDDATLLREELGDLLLQVVFHARIAEEENKFDISHVINDITAKLVHRHPHVFAKTVVEDSADVLRNWEKIKSVEKERKTVAMKMDAVPPALPALMRADKLAKVAAKVGFDFASPEDAFAKIEEELAEVKSVKTREEAFEEIGDLFFAVANYARKMGISSEEAAEAAGKKFACRFAEMEKAMEKDGLSCANLDTETMEKYWCIVKSNKK